MVLTLLGQNGFSRIKQVNMGISPNKARLVAQGYTQVEGLTLVKPSHL